MRKGVIIMTVWMVSAYEMYKSDSYNSIKLFDSQEKALDYFKAMVDSAHNDYYNEYFRDMEDLVIEERCGNSYVIYELDNYCENHIEISMSLKEVE